MNESKLGQKFPVKLFRRLHVSHPQIDVIKATRFHLVILNRIGWPRYQIPMLEAVEAERRG